MNVAVLAGRIDALLPQTQCTRCGYPHCRAYAEAIADGLADINECPPGGPDTMRALAVLCGRPPKTLNPAHGTGPIGQIALIDESQCIGCTKCIQACPVDAIVGASKQMHTVVAGWCTGCELCIAPCPVDCISLRLVTPADTASEWALPTIGEERTEALRRRYRAHTARLGGHREAEGRDSLAPAGTLPGRALAHRAEIAAAIARVHARRAKRGPQRGGAR